MLSTPHSVCEKWISNVWIWFSLGPNFHAFPTKGIPCGGLENTGFRMHAQVWVEGAWEERAVSAAAWGRLVQKTWEKLLLGCNTLSRFLPLQLLLWDLSNCRVFRDYNFTLWDVTLLSQGDTFWVDCPESIKIDISFSESVYKKHLGIVPALLSIQIM